MTAIGQARPLPRWMLVPGAPPRPNPADFHARMNQLREEKQKCFEEIKALQISLGNNEEKALIDAERNVMRSRLDQLDQERKAHQQLRLSIDAEMNKIRAQRREASDKLRALETELGGLSDIKEIDAAISHLMKRMETSSGGLVSERKTANRLHQLEEAKSLLQLKQPLSESIADTVERENLLHLEYREVLERINGLNKDFEDQLGIKRVKDREAWQTGANRSEVYQKCDAVRVRINDLNAEMQALRSEYTNTTNVWDTWASETREKHNAKIEAERAERQRQHILRQNETKNEEKLRRAGRRQNRYEMEMNACDALIVYLRDKKHITLQDEEERKKHEATATFDASKSIPDGFVVLNESQWSKKPLNKASRIQQKQRVAPNAGKTASPLQYPEDKMRLFQLISQDPPLSVTAIDDTIKAINEKKRLYVSHIAADEAVLSSDDEEQQPDASDEQVDGTGKEEEQPVEEIVA